MDYEQMVANDLTQWKKEMVRKPSVMNKLSKKIQTKLNSYIPEKIHKAITATIKQMVRGVLFGAQHTTKKPALINSLQETENEIERLVKTYKHTAAVEGGLTGADFPILLGIKLKMLFDIAALYGFDTKDYKERLYILHIFQLAFSSHEHRRNVFLQMQDWDQKKNQLPEDVNAFDWRMFQQEYRDYIDLAKMAQLIPGIGAVVGIVVNYKLIKQLAHTAINAYRMRLYKS